MATARTAPQKGSITPFVLALTVPVVLLAIAFRLPAAPLAAIGIAIAAWGFVMPEPVRGVDPDPAMVAKQRRWRELRWKTLLPNSAWLMHPASELDDFRKRAGALVRIPVLGDLLGVLAWALLPTRFVSVAAVAAAAVAVTLPVDGSLLSITFPAWAVIANAVYAYVCVTAVDNVVRQTITAFDPSPGVLIAALCDGLRSKDGGAWRTLIGFGVLGAVVAFAAALLLWWADYALPFGFLYLIVPWPLVPIGLGLAVAACAMHAALRTSGLEAWREMTATRAAWDARWESLKQPEMHLKSHEKVGAAVVDTFSAPPSLGSARALKLYPQVLPFLGSNVQAAMLAVPDTDSQGQPVPGSAHPSDFRVVVWPSDTDVDIGDPATPEEVVKLRVETMVFEVCNQGSYDSPTLLDISSLQSADSARAAWGTGWTSEVPAAGTVGRYLGAEAFSDGTDLFFGDFDNATLRNKQLLARREELEAINRWSIRWRDVLKKGAMQPKLEYKERLTAKFDRDTELTFQPFLYPQGLTLQSYFEPAVTQALSSTLVAAPFVTVTGLTGRYVRGGRPGDRFPQGLAVIWSAKPVPCSPALIPPPTPPASREAVTWVLAGALNNAFDAAKLDRPELVKAECLTTRRSSGHVWRLDVRLFGATTAASVKTKMGILKAQLGGTPWLRVTEWDYGVSIYAGAVPHGEGVCFDRPDALTRCDELDWEQAFLELNLVAADGSAPRMLSAEALPSNPKVTRAEFTLPSPLSLGKVKENISKLRPATGNEYVDVQATNDATHMVVQFSQTNPMPFPALMEWDKALDASSEAIPFASAVDGHTMVFNPKAVAHQLILGGSGSGKSATLQMFLCGALMRADVIVVDTVKGGADFAFAKPWLKAFIGHNELIAAGEVLMWCREEMLRRAELNASYGVGSYRDLPADVRPRHMYVFIDEFNQMMDPIAVAKEPASSDPSVVAEWEKAALEKAAQAKVAAAVKAITTGARSAGITLLIAGQSLKADLLKAHNLTGFKANYARIALGKMSWGDLASAFKDSSTLPDLGNSIPKGRGIWETDDDPAAAFQSWFEPGGQDEMHRRLAEVLPYRDPAEQLDIAALTASVTSAAPRAFGQIIETDEDDTVVELTADDLDLDGLVFDGDALDMSAMDFELPSDEFAADDMAVDLPEAAEPFVMSDELQAVPAAPELLEPPTDAPLSVGEPLPEPVRYADPEPLFEVASDPLSGTVTVSDVPIAGALVFGIDLPLPLDAPVTGWVKSEAVWNLVQKNPDIELVRWGGRDLHDEDDLGVPHIAVVEEMLARAHVRFEQVTPPPAVVAKPKPVPASDEDDWFAAPTSKTAPAIPDIDF